MTASDVPAATPAGWYPDPSDQARLRRWDGRSWTDDVVVATGTPAPAPVPEPTPSPEPPEPTNPPEPTAPEPQVVAEDEQVPTTGSTSLPDWATLPGLTLPPDLSSIPGFTANPGLPMPRFEEPDRALPPESEPGPATTPPNNPEQFTTPQQRPPVTLANSPAPQSRRELRALREMHGEEASPAPAEAAAPWAGAPAPAHPSEQASARERPAQSAPAPSESYAPPPSGAQFSAPPPPGVAYTPPVTSHEPAFAFGMVPSSSLATAAIRNEGIEHGQPSRPAVATAPRIPSAPGAPRVAARPSSVNTLGVWLIAVLPLLHFAVLYVVFQVLSQPFIPGTQWGILAAPAVFSLLFAALDRRTLAAHGRGDVPSIVWAIIPPLYLIVRSGKVGSQSLVALLVWVVLQAAAVAGAFALMSTVLASALSS